MKPRIMLISSVPMTLWVFYRVLIEKLQSDGYDLTVVSSPAEELSRIRDCFGCRTLGLQIHRKLSPLADACAVLRLVLHLRREKYDIVHAHTPKAGIIGMLASFIARVPVRIYTMHGMPLETAKGYKRQLLRCVESMTFRLATKRLIVSRSLSERAIAEKITKPGEFEILGDGTACGVDRQRFNSKKKNESVVHDLRRKYGLDPETVVIGFVGRIVPDKGIVCLLDAFDILRRRCSVRVSLFIVGEYENVRESVSDDTRRRIEQDKSIVSCGRTDDIVSCYYAMDLLVLPSRREGFNYALIEAAACGLPTITTRATGCVDAVVEGETGYIVDVDDAQRLADAMQKLVENPQQRYAFGCKGEERIEQFFKSDRLLSEHLNLYNSLR